MINWPSAVRAMKTIGQPTVAFYLLASFHLAIVSIVSIANIVGRNNIVSIVSIANTVYINRTINIIGIIGINFAPNGLWLTLPTALI